jgi:hypothetical protein
MMSKWALAYGHHKDRAPEEVEKLSATRRPIAK